ncbi:MAG: hypothetical protein A2X36_14620 [Elusimicrobia bacterium GWA2_69_24]|nr:MAG: hypothetical protein A2X36_14620 [Elusimicrobia bacterium GWA2_69_24]HBL18372.1 hypothetical protein [Elusimicrobiota bacterium]
MTEAAGGTLKGKRAMVLAAGLGTRLRPMTEHIPKPLVPVGGRPLLKNVLMNLQACGVSEIAVNTHHLADQVRDFVRGFAGGEGIRLFHEPRILGTGGALVNAREFLLRDRFFLLHNADVLTDLDLTALSAAHRDDAVATLALTDFAPENKVLVSGEGVVLDILGRLGAKPREDCRLLTYTGVAVLSRELLAFLPAQGPASLTEALIRVAAEQPGRVRAFVPERVYWNDLGTLRSYRRAHEDLLVRRSIALRGIELPKEPILVREGAKVARGAKLSGFVCVGKGARVEAGAEVEDSILLDGAVAARGRRYRLAVIGRDFSISQEWAPPAQRRILREAGFGADVQCVPLVEQGSDRQFYRVVEGKRSAVLMITPPDDPDFARYLQIGRYLHQRDLGVPEILRVDEADHCVLLEDLGDATLYLMARQERDEMDLKRLYGGVIDLLVGLQLRATAALGECPAAGERALDYGQLRWETNYFRENFLESFLGLPRERSAALDGEFHRLAERAASQPEVFIHRDFQSQNILMKGGRARIVDFQGGRRGPIAYDLASLLRDPYVRLPAGVRDSLAERYRTGLAAAGGPALSAEELRLCLLSAGLQRNMQALGAYCFLWLNKGKPQFRKFILPGLTHLEEGLAEFNRLGEDPLPKLAAALAQAREGIDASLRREPRETGAVR